MQSAKERTPPSRLPWTRRSIGPFPPLLSLMMSGLRRAAKNDRLMLRIDPLLKPFNPLHPMRRSNPYPLYDTLRAEGAVVEHPRFGGWMVTGFDECEAALRLSEASSDLTEVVNQFPPYAKMAPLTVEFFGNWMLFKDPPAHTRIRRYVSRAFTPRSMEQLEPRVAEIAALLLADTEGCETFDIVEVFGNRFPIYVIGELLGLPEADWPWLKGVSDQIAMYVDAVNGFDPAEMDKAALEVYDYMSKQIELRRANPTDDLIGRLVMDEEAGERLSAMELVGLVSLVMGAGHETTTNFFGNSIVALSEHADQRKLLADRPELLDNAIEELLRFDAPVQMTIRNVVAPAEFYGQTLKAGDDISVMIGAANRDPRKFDSPNELRLDRDDPRSITFGHGIHHCVGAALARMEARVALPLVLARLGEYEVEEVVWGRSFTLRGPERLVVRPG